MLNRWTSVALFGVVWGLSPSVNAAETPLSYVADNQCFCNLSASTSLHERIVATPVGGQSVAQICERIGSGPALIQRDGQYNFPVYDDMQCGHGPGFTGFIGLLNDAGTDLKDAPKWDLAAAYVASTESSQALAQSEKTLLESKVAKAAVIEEVAEPDALELASSETTPTRRFKPRYVKAPEVTEQAPVATAAAPKTPAPKITPKITDTTKAVAATEQAPKTSVKNIERLPLATTEPVAAAAVAELAPSSDVPSVTVKAPIVVADDPVTKETLPQEKEIQEVAENLSTGPAISVPASNALRLPASVRASSQEFAYVSLMPVNYDFGGAGGRFTGSFAPGNKLRFILRAAAADSYQEASVGASYILTPSQADRLTFALTAGVEYGRFSLDAQNIETTVDDAGVFTQLNSRFVLNNRFELQGGVGFSSFFDGDPHAFGAALYHLTRTLDLSGEFEVGDNDSVGLGLRYYY